MKTIFIMRNALGILLFLVACHSGSAQIQGIVLDAGSGLPLEKAEVKSLRSDTLIYTDEEGKFSFPVPDSLQIIFYGYSPVILYFSADNASINLHPLPFSLQEVTISSPYTERRLLDQPSAISIISAEDFKYHSQYPSIILNQVPGVFMHSGTMNTNRLTIRGIGARNPYATTKLRVFLDNIPLTNGSGETVMEDLDWSLLNRAEVYKGPAPGQYGSGLGGTLVLHSGWPEKEKSSVFVSSSVGRWGLWQEKIGGGWNSAKGTGQITISHLKQDGYRDNNTLQRDMVSLRTRHPGGKGMLIDFTLIALQMNAGIPSSIDSIQLADQPSAAAPAWLNTKGREKYSKLLLGISGKKILRNGLNASFSMSFNAHKGEERRPFDFLNEERTGVTMRVGIAKDFFQKRLQLNAGAEVLPEIYSYRLFENIGGIGQKGIMFSDNRELFISSSFYIQAVNRLTERIRATAGISLNAAAFYYKDLFHPDSNNLSGHYKKDLIPAPRLGVEYYINPENIFFIGLSRGFDMPSLSETLTENGIINPSIRPETCLNLETGLRGEVFIKRLRYNFSIYSMYIQDLLVAERTGNDTWVGKNAGRAVNKGAELELTYFLIKRMSEWTSGGEWLIFSASGSLNDYRFKEFTQDGIDFAGKRLAGVPLRNASSSLEYRYNYFYLVGTWLFTGPQYLRDDGSESLESWSVGSLASGYTLHINKNWELFLSGTIMNVSNRPYVPMVVVNAPVPAGKLPRYYYPGQPRHVQLEIKLRRKL
ncbi:MAG: TonB-dependent receptor [Bacteroidales bacterium]